MKPLHVIALLVVLYSLISPALGIGVSPSSIDFGSVYRRDSSISYVYISSNKPESVQLYIHGLLSKYISINPSHLDINPGKLYRVELVLHPQLANGNYSDLLIVNAYTNTTTSYRSSSIIESIAIPLRVSITGEQIFSCSLLDAQLLQSCNNKLVVRLTIHNNGSVAINPDVSITISNSSNNFFSKKLSTNYVLPGSIDDVFLSTGFDYLPRNAPLVMTISTICGDKSLVFVNPTCRSIDIPRVSITKHKDIVVLHTVITNNKHTPRYIKIYTTLYKDGVIKVLSSKTISVEPHSTQNVSIPLRASNGELSTKIIEVTPDGERIINQYSTPLKQSRHSNEWLIIAPLILFGLFIIWRKKK